MLEERKFGAPALEFSNFAGGVAELLSAEAPSCSEAFCSNICKVVKEFVKDTDAA